MVIALGARKLADVPVPFAEPADPVPARVVTTPVEITIFRIVLFQPSTTYRFVPSVVI